ncbi:MAG: FAD-dependent oxidoreductase [Leptolyngbya sp. SIO3F4]|nr:FAD-dependent oxidoreductase [Leptolyngbya sp. SIO3F4]
MTQTQNQYDIAIVGAGVCGTAVTYLLSRYTNIKRIVVLEKCGDAATINSRVSNNSQTLHFGDIETNYTLEKATKVNSASSLVKHYLLKYDPYQEMHSKYNKMVLAVGQEQISILERRYHEFRALFPSLRIVDRAEIQKLEPNILKGRDPDEAVSALFTEEGFTVNFQKLAKSFLENAAGSQTTTVDVRFNTQVTNIQKGVDGYLIDTSSESIQAKTVVIAAGAYSLLFAKSLGYGKDYALLSVAGSFYRSRSVLNGKVYTMQSKKLPFAAIHGDPEVHDPSITRFGPTAKVLVQLERYRSSTIIDYFRTAGLSLAAILSFAAILLDLTILKYIVRNFLYDIPFIGRRLFIHEVRRIVPDMRLEDLEYAKGYGGIRPQIVNMKTRKLELGEAKIVGDGILFNITPSPGASTCLQNAEDDAERIVAFLGDGYHFDKERFHHDLSVESQHVSSNDEQTEQTPITK